MPLALLYYVLSVSQLLLIGIFYICLYLALALVLVFPVYFQGGLRLNVR